MSAPTPLPRSGGFEQFANKVECSLAKRASAARRGIPTAGLDDDWLFEDESELDCALVLAFTQGGSASASLLRIVTGTERPDLRLYWRRSILPYPKRTAQIVARLVQTGASARWLAGFDDSELRAATARILSLHGALGLSVVPGTTSEVRQHIAQHVPAPAAEEMSPASRNVRTLIASLTPMAHQAHGAAETPDGIRLITVALVAQHRPVLIGLTAFADAVETLVNPAVRPTSPMAIASNKAPVASGLKRPTSDHLNKTTPSPRHHMQSGKGPSGDFGPAPAVFKPYSTPRLSCMPAAKQQTDFGGLLFLLNAFVALGLWGDFTRPADSLSGLSPFELLVRLGRHWFGEVFLADPLHRVLRHLSGLQPGEVAGGHFVAPPWSVPGSWLTPWPEVEAQDKPHGRWHPAGFPLNDPAASKRSLVRQRRHWIIALARYLCARTAVAIGVARKDVPALLCCRQAELEIERESLIVRLSLQDHPLAVRMAGLDRDPGRLAGCTHAVAFEFTS